MKSFKDMRRKGKKRPRAYREYKAQRSVIEWAELSRLHYPGINLIYKNANEGQRPGSQVARFKKEGLRPGVPDLFLPVARGDYHGLYIEMKSLENTSDAVTDSQQWWLKELNAQGYLSKVCFGAEDAINLLKRYYGLPANNNHSRLQREARNMGQEKS